MTQLYCLNNYNVTCCQFVSVQINTKILFVTDPSILVCIEKLQNDILLQAKYNVTNEQTYTHQTSQSINSTTT